MSKTTDLTKTYSGIFGNQVELTSRKGKSTMTIRPVRATQVPSEKQIDQRRKFSLAALYARTAKLDPAVWAEYKAKSRKGMSAYTLATNDYLIPPYVQQIDASNYNGTSGNTISVTAGDNFKVVGVSVCILDSLGAVVETGECTFSLPTGKYDYTTTVDVPDVTGFVIVAKATDTPGHSTELSITL